MRSVRLSRTFADTLKAQLRFGAERYPNTLVEEKRGLVERTIFEVLRRHPGIGRMNEELGLRSFRVSRTPFILLYEFDDSELRIHMIVHVRADQSRIDPAKVEW